jgi:hypothetical protein
VRVSALERLTHLTSEDDVMPAWDLPLLDATPDDFEEITATQAPDLGLLQQAGAAQRTSSSVSGITPMRHRLPPAPPVRLLALDTLRALLRRFTDDAGPAARPLMLREISLLGARPETFPLLLSGQLIAAMGQLLDDDTTRRHFLADAHRILKSTP